MALIRTNKVESALDFVEAGKFYVLPWSTGFNFSEVPYTSGVATNLGAIEVFTAIINTKNVASIGCNYTASTSRVYGIKNGTITEIGSLTASNKTLNVDADYVVLVARASGNDVTDQRYTITNA